MSDQKQCTLKAAASVSGLGIHTGEKSKVTIHPSDIDSGIKFLTPNGEIPAHINYVSDTQRGTSLRNGDAEIHTVEHLLSALAGLQIDNALVEVTGPEVPIMDGSALPFVEAIESVGICEQSALPREVKISMPEWIVNGDKYLFGVPAGFLIIKALICFSHPMLGEQAISIRINPEVFKRDIAPARTFCTSDEIESILKAGLGKGGSEENVVVAYEDRYSVPLRYNDEFVRHKVLDLVGDLSLVGGRLSADIVAIKSSHTINTGLAARIAKKHLCS